MRTEQGVYFHNTGFLRVLFFTHLSLSLFTNRLVSVGSPPPLRFAPRRPLFVPRHRPPSPHGPRRRGVTVAPPPATPPPMEDADDGDVGPSLANSVPPARPWAPSPRAHPRTSRKTPIPFCVPVNARPVSPKCHRRLPPAGQRPTPVLRPPHPHPGPGHAAQACCGGPAFPSFLYTCSFATLYEELTKLIFFWILPFFTIFWNFPSFPVFSTFSPQISGGKIFGRPAGTKLATFFFTFFEDSCDIFPRSESERNVAM